MLRDTFPDARIGWAIDTELAPAIEGHPALDYIHRCSRNRWKRGLARPPQWLPLKREFMALVREVRLTGYDVAIDVQGLFKTALLPWLAGIKRRVGYRQGREFSSLFYTERFRDRNEYFDPAVFHLEHMAGLVGMLRGPGAQSEYRAQPPAISEVVRKRVTEQMSKAFLNSAPVIAMAPATQWASKAWPEEYWIVLIHRLLTRTRLNLLLLGSSADESMARRVLGACSTEQLTGRVCNLFGKSPLPAMYAVYEHVAAAVGPDSAPLHVAGAMGVPVLIGIYGPTGFRRTPPLGSPHIRLLSTEGLLACQPCHQRVCPLGTGECMTRIGPDDVYEALLENLNASGINWEWPPMDAPISSLRYNEKRSAGQP
jgi:lipopolysaccharide heptosyltransferase II